MVGFERLKLRYPAISFKGRAAFNFGPDFKHKAPGFGKTFVAWPGMADGLLRADCPIIGNSNNATRLNQEREGEQMAHVADMLYWSHLLPMGDGHD